MAPPSFGGFTRVGGQIHKEELEFKVGLQKSRKGMGAISWRVREESRVVARKRHFRHIKGEEGKEGKKEAPSEQTHQS